MDAAILLPMTADAAEAFSGFSSYAVCVETAASAAVSAVDVDAAASISVAEITMDADAAEIFSGSLFFCAAAINLPLFPRKP